MFVSWATGSRFGLTAPWNVLDEISLDGLVLSFNFETKDVRLTKPLDPPLDLGSSLSPSSPLATVRIRRPIRKRRFWFR
jgi:hypothetical protein